MTQSQISDLPQDACGSFFMAIVFLFTLIRSSSGDELWDHANWILQLCDGLWQILDEIPPSTTVLRTETEMEPL
ncbi:hypothetical protein V1505DRAFT_381360 [Lipomyces doorenjongii]